MNRILKLLIGPLLAALFFTGCQSINELLFGEANTPAQQAYQEKAKLYYVDIPVRNYVALPDANVDVKAAVCNLEQVVYDSGISAAGVALSGGDNITQILAAMAGGLASLSLEVFGDVIVPQPEEIVHKTIILARVGTASVLEMRLWRKNFVEVKSNEFVASQRDPNEDEWRALDAKVNEIHTAIRQSCGDAEPA